MSSVGILAWKSALEHGNAYAVPDFRDEAARRVYEDDHWRPMDLDDPQAPPISSRNKPREVITERLAEARALWAKLGYTGGDQ
mgnify:CR=1 FL=1